MMIRISAISVSLVAASRTCRCLARTAQSMARRWRAI